MNGQVADRVHKIRAVEVRGRLASDIQLVNDLLIEILKWIHKLLNGGLELVGILGSTLNALLGLDLIDGLGSKTLDSVGHRSTKFLETLKGGSCGIGRF